MNEQLDLGIINKPLEVRAHWDIKDLIIEIK